MKSLFFFLSVILCLRAYAQSGTIDPFFNPGDAGHYLGQGPQGSVEDAVVLPGGKVIICGSMLAYNGTSLNNGIARLTANGLLDTSFHTPGPSINNSGFSLCLQSDGKILLGGGFGSFGGLGYENLVRLNDDGSVDSAFCENVSVNGYVHDVVLLSGQRIAICGAFSMVNGTAANGIAVLLPDGTRDISFIDYGFGTLEEMAVQADGRIIAVGSTFSGTDNGIIRFNHDGSRDDTFQNGIGFNDVARCISLRPDGSMLVGGNFSTYSGVAVQKLVLLDANGLYNTSFQVSPGLFSSVEGVRKLTALADGRVFGCGLSKLFRFLPDGSLDESFGQVGRIATNNATAVTPYGLGQYIAVGNYSMPQRRSVME